MAGNVDLSQFLRRCRGRVDPQSVGLPERGAYRRVPGLRREEVAQLAGVSTDYYTRLEQGRNITPSDGVLDAVAGALRLDDAERAHLYDLVKARPGRRAGRTAPGVQRARPGLLRFLESFHEHAAFILGRRGDILATNHLCRVLIADFDAMPYRERNLTRWIVLSPEARELYADWERLAAEMTAILRLDAGRYPDDARTAELVGELTMKSTYFRGWWDDHRVLTRTHGQKRFNHPLVGELTIDYQALTPPGEEDQTLFLYMPAADRTSQEAWRLLADWNTPAPDRPRQDASARTPSASDDRNSP
ncbi:helix-turn-helix transcriptional regulator [Streptomyces rugosispiralis]|uniref:Helix-turn-helix transcriptional regulator n=1 Tax=Streptomyces rugosispiralis TaxID=2967341 RepID=A0ABT1URZ6_9ACTN|nr:helix-turn-helix transcriptional regulator [Streptomyces rugosispiralis]MCQ8187901.1 helix-turn-helix transcriptional regulator [Streptomyces rugosispiralis]